MLDSKIIGKIIKKERQCKKLSQELISGFADIGRTHLSMIERGERTPTLQTFYKIAEALEIPASELMKKIEFEIESSHKIC